MGRHGETMTPHSALLSGCTKESCISSTMPRTIYAGLKSVELSRTL